MPFTLTPSVAMAELARRLKTRRVDATVVETPDTAQPAGVDVTITSTIYSVYLNGGDTAVYLFGCAFIWGPTMEHMHWFPSLVVTDEEFDKAVNEIVAYARARSAALRKAGR